MQSLTGGPLVDIVPTAIGIVTFLVIACLVYWKKNSKIIELLTTQKIIVPLLLLIGIGAVEAGIAVVFGRLSPLIMAIVQIVSPIFMALLVHSAIAWLVKNFTNYF